MKFPLAYSTLQWETPNLERDLSTLLETGWEGWEIRQSLDWLGSAKRIQKICKKIGIRVAAVCGPNVTLSLKDKVQEINKRKIEFSSDLECATFMTKGPSSLDRPTTEEDLDRMAAVYDDLAVYAEPLGVTVTFHPHINHVVDSADEWERFMPRLKHCQLCLDLSHLILWGCDPIQAIQNYKNNLAYIHLHDYKDGQNVELGEGPMYNFSAFLKTLDEVGYNSWITVCPGTTNRSENDKMRINRAYLKSIGF